MNQNSNNNDGKGSKSPLTHTKSTSEEPQSAASNMAKKLASNFSSFSSYSLKSSLTRQSMMGQKNKNPHLENELKESGRNQVLKKASSLASEKSNLQVNVNIC